MQKNKILVLGDSFGLLDDENRHWMELWAKRYDLYTDHYAIAGGNHVTIASNFLSASLNLSNVRAVVFMVTDMIRSEAIEINENFDFCPRDIPKILDTFTARPSRLDWNDIFKRNFYGEPICDAQDFYKRVMLPNQYEELPTTKAFYDVASCRWIAKANYLSLQFIIRYFLMNNIPILLVNTIWDQGNSLHTLDTPGAFRWDWVENKLSDKITYLMQTNHISLEQAEEIADNFDSFNISSNFIELTSEEKTRYRLAQIRKRDPFIYR
jgi:hypothetical protein